MDCPSRNRDQLTVIDLGIAILAAATAGEVLFLVVILCLFVCFSVRKVTVETPVHRSAMLL